MQPAGHNTIVIREAFQSEANGANETEINFSQLSHRRGEMAVVNISRSIDSPASIEDSCVLLDGSDVYGASQPDGWLDVMRRFACPMGAAYLLVDVLQVKAGRERLVLSGGDHGGPAFTEDSPAHASLHLDEYFYTETASELATDSNGDAVELPFDSFEHPRTSRCAHVDVAVRGNGSAVQLTPRCGISTHRNADGLGLVGGFAAAGNGHFVYDGLVTAPNRWFTPHYHKKRRFRFVTDEPTTSSGDVRTFVLAPSDADDRFSPPNLHMQSCSGALECVGSVIECTCVDICDGSTLRWVVVTSARLTAVHAVGTCNDSVRLLDQARVYALRVATLGPWPSPPPPKPSSPAPSPPPRIPSPSPPPSSPSPLPPSPSPPPPFPSPPPPSPSPPPPSPSPPPPSPLLPPFPSLPLPSRPSPPPVKNCDELEDKRGRNCKTRIKRLKCKPKWSAKTCQKKIRKACRKCENTCCEAGY